MINIFVTHYVDESCPELNDVTEFAIAELERTAQAYHRTTVIGYATTDALWYRLVNMLGLYNVEVIRHASRAGRPDRPPSLRNRALAIASGRSYSPFVLLHNDIRPAPGWLERLVMDLRWAEHKWGWGSSIVTPKCIPYHRDASDVMGTSVRTPEEMAAWCLNEGLALDDDGRVQCRLWDEPLELGHQLTQFITRPSFFDAVGPCDESFVGVNYDDSDWGVRALMAGKHSLISTTGCIGHAEGTTAAARGATATMIDLSCARYAEKWGQAGLDELHDGSVWTRLRAPKMEMKK